MNDWVALLDRGGQTFLDAPARLSAHRGLLDCSKHDGRSRAQDPCDHCILFSRRFPPARKGARGHQQLAHVDLLTHPPILTAELQRYPLRGQTIVEEGGVRLA